MWIEFNDYRQRSTFTINIYDHRQRSLSMITVNDHRQRSPSMITVNDHRQRSPSMINIYDHILDTHLIHDKSNKHRVKLCYNEIRYYRICE